MGAATQVTDLADLRRDLLRRLRDATGISAINTIIDGYLNTALHDLHINPGHNFPWQVRRATILTHAPYTTGTVTIAAISRTTVTGSSTAWNTAVTGMGFNNARAGGKITFSGSSEIYEVLTVDSDTQITLNYRYTGAALSGSNYTYFEDEYALASDFWRPFDMREFSQDMEIRLIGAKDFRRRYPRNNMTGRPRVATFIQLPFSSNVTPRYRVTFHPAPNDELTVPYYYMTTNLAVSSAGVEQTQLINETDEPIVPLRYRHIIVLQALYNILRDRKDDLKSQEVKAEFIDMMRRIASDVGIGRDNPRFQPDLRGYARAPRRGRFDVGDWFAQMRW